MRIITELITTIRARYGITPEILSELKPGDGYFPPLFEKEELSRIDIHEPSSSSTPPRIIAFGDIHGDLQSLVGILYAAELIDVSGNWIEERSTYVVQTGDLFDNYRPEIKNSCLKDPENLLDEFIILNYLTHLHRQAQQMKAKSRIVLCIGNHEFINLTGDRKRMTEYVIPKSPLTIDERIELFKPGGIFATKLSSIFRVIVKIGNYLFMHGGMYEGNITSLNDILTYNNNLNEWLNKRTTTLSTNIYSGEDKTYSSITWYRKMTDTNEAGYISFLQRLDAEHELKVIVGHTITNKEVDVPPIVIRASGRIILLDTAMSRCWNNKNRQSCDLSNNRYNISFIVIEEDMITPNNKRTLIDRISSAVAHSHSGKKSSSSSSSSSSPKRKTSQPKRRGNSPPKQKTVSSKRRGDSVADSSSSSSSSSPTHSKNGGKIRSRNNRIRKYIIQK
jgi:hypothetical protein